jgi:hypothetical protein
MRSSAIAFKEMIGNKIISIAEIGVCAGKNAKELYDNFRIKKMYLCDWYREKYSPEVINWLKSVYDKFNEDKRVTLIINNSLDIQDLFHDSDIDYIYLDGDHAFDHVYAEMELYWPKVSYGGMLAGHDYNEKNPDRVKAAVEKFCKKYNLHYQSKPNKNEEVSDWYIIKR